VECVVQASRAKYPALAPAEALDQLLRVMSANLAAVAAAKGDPSLCRDFRGEWRRHDLYKVDPVHVGRDGLSDQAQRFIFCRLSTGRAFEANLLRSRTSVLTVW
jgi:hypothetical protein